MNPSADPALVDTQGTTTPDIPQPMPVADPIVVAATNLSTTLSEAASTPESAPQDIVDYQTKRLNDAIDGYNQAIPVQADFSALKAAQARAKALLEQMSATQGEWVARRVALGMNPGSIINGYDVSTYATDPLYEQKIQSILYALPPFATPNDLDVYIQTFFPGSPVTGNMVFAAANQYNVDMPLLIAIMQNDSQFGTLGIGAKTFNPGNVGNTGLTTQSYPSWDLGVAAVAEWLNNHRATVAPVPDSTPLPTIDATQQAPVASPVTEPSFDIASPVSSTSTAPEMTIPSVDSIATTPGMDLTTSSTTPGMSVDVSSTTPSTEL